MYNMLSNMMSMMVISMSLVLVLSSTPLNMGLWIIFTTLIISISMSISIQSWFSLILFLVYIGGLLVMFAYFVSIQPNQQMKMMKMIFTMMLTSSLFIPTALNYTMPQSTEQTTYTSITELLLINNIQTLALLALVLFFALVAVVKMTKMYMGPLRPFN